MKNLLVSLLFLTLVFGGCKTSPETLAHRSLGTIAISVQTARDAYYDYRDKNPTKVSNELDDRLKQAYRDYQNAFEIAETAQKVAKISSQPVSQDVFASVTAASEKFVNLVVAANPNFVRK